MRNMSFSLTTQQMRDRTKTVTRRLGWNPLMPGNRVCAVVKGMGLKKGEKVERICVIEVVSNKKESLMEITESDCALEGFPALSKHEFAELFAKANKCSVFSLVNRIEFTYVN